MFVMKMAMMMMMMITSTTKMAHVVAAEANGVRGGTEPDENGVAIARRSRALKGMMMKVRPACSRRGSGKAGRLTSPACPPAETRRSSSSSPTRAPVTPRPTEAPTPAPTRVPTAAPTDGACASAVPHANGHKYLYRNTSSLLLWEEARVAAEAFLCCGARGHLATITDEAENAAVAGVLRDDAWIGLREYIEDSWFEWVDGTPAVYYNWGYIGRFQVISVGINYGDGKWLGLDYFETKLTNYVVEFDCV